jgi:FKBP-type peptidyl-prolyl cis-trans isomerase FklB
MRSRAQTGIAFRGRARWGLRVSSPSSYEPSFESVEQRVSYGIALNMGANLTRQGVEIDVGAFMAGLIDGLAQRKPRVSEAALQEAFAAAQKKADEHTAAQAAHQSGAAQAFLKDNKARPGVVVTESGLQYEVLRTGKGVKPTRDQTVEVHYHGTLTDGTVFDSSVERGETISFPVTGVIPGWVEALQLMTVGSKWRLVIPSDLAYGDRGQGPIPAGATLIFEVELIGID